jgi:hypothetical protein
VEIRALTVRQPWAALIVSGEKTVENRGWRTNYRGLLLIHAGSRPDPDGPAFDGPITFGAIIGVVELTDVIRDSTSPWAEPDCWHWRVADPQPLTPIPCRGALRLWRPAPPVIHAVRAQLADVGNVPHYGAGG